MIDCPPIVLCMALLGAKDGSTIATAERTDNVGEGQFTSSTYGPRVRTKDFGDLFVSSDKCHVVSLGKYGHGGQPGWDWGTRCSRTRCGPKPRHLPPATEQFSKRSP